MSFPVSLAAHLSDHAGKMKQFLTQDYRKENAVGRHRMAAEARRISSWAAAAVAPMPIPFADVWTITPIQMMMVKAIGNIYGYPLDDKTVKALLGTIGGGWLGQQVCLALFKIGLPGAGGLGGAAFVFVWTHALGHAAEVYFASGMTASTEQLAAARKRGTKEAHAGGAEHSG
jgi:uncharacterized protein (DUF697 family)